MASPRQRRLENDYRKIRQEFTGHPYIEVIPTGGNPPEKYLLKYKVAGLRLDATDTPKVHNDFTFEMYLHQNFPREKPRIFTRCEIFHPNIADWVCIGDYWASGETLSDVIIQIGEMIQYRTYNPRSPLNGLAARWASENSHLLPVGKVDLYLAEPEISLGAEKGTDEADLGIILK